MAYEKYTVGQFKRAWFEKDYSELSQEDFKIVYAEYLDTSGLFMSDDFEKQSFVRHLSQRINSVKIFIRLQREFMNDFQMPFIRDFEHFKQEYGYVLKWRNDLEEFELQLKKVESREIKHQSFLEDKIKELNDSRKNNQKKIVIEEDEDGLRKSRHSFIRMINSLCKLNYKIEDNVTSVESLALMIKQQMEEVENLKT